MRPFTSSIRRHLLCWLLIPIVSLCFLGALVTYVIAVGFATEAYDDALLDCAHSVSARLEFVGSRPNLDLPPAALAILKHSDIDEFYYQVSKASGEIINGDEYMPSLPADEEVSEEPIFYDGNVNAHPVRVCAIRVPIPKHHDYLVIKVAETTIGRSDLIQSIILGVVLPQLLLILFAAAAVWLGVARGLSPLRTLKEAVEKRNPADLSLLEEINVPKEVKPLVIAINNLLSHLDEDREAQRRFVSNAAHQLRTPLAGLKTQTELALRNQNPDDLRQSLKHINTSANRATRLAQQLLALARLEPSVFKSVKSEAVDLNSIVKSVCNELVPQALSKEIDLGFESPDAEAVITGDKNSLHELTVNLLENAILYTQKGGKVTARVRMNAKGASLIVEDNGPGIPPAERKQVFERFYRVLGNKVAGSGLGLAIVREIAEAHKAEVDLRDGPSGVGTTIEVQFKKLDYPNAALEMAEIGASGQ
ncbi:MAG: sensor histidine kinase [Candidatus Obscuribacterales bacterium]|nr:sensor histidine kinase [Candidatus Obscuribacterales bacterium]